MKLSYYKFRKLIQFAVTIFINSYMVGFMKGKIYTGNFKYICAPGLNCHSCPGAISSCPIGALQSVLGGLNRNIPYYVIGFLVFFGTLLGRFVCGFLCPFGLIQELIYKIKTPKIKVVKKVDKILRYFKYIILIVFVILFPIMLTDKFGLAPPYFCELICPAGTLEAGIPLVAQNESLRPAIGILFYWKVSVLVITIVSSIFICRPFCKYVCPLGALYAFFNKFSIYQFKVDSSKCTGCEQCEHACKMNVEILKKINSPECIRCGKCQAVCPTGAISSGFSSKNIILCSDIQLNSQK